MSYPASRHAALMHVQRHLITHVRQVPRPCSRPHSLSPHCRRNHRTRLLPPPPSSPAHSANRRAPSPSPSSSIARATSVQVWQSGRGTARSGCRLLARVACPPPSVSAPLRRCSSPRPPATTTRPRPSSRSRRSRCSPLPRAAREWRSSPTRFYRLFGAAVADCGRRSLARSLRTRPRWTARPTDTHHR